jgi:hypothetical protein
MPTVDSNRKVWPSMNSANEVSNIRIQFAASRQEINMKFFFSAYL